MAIDATLGMKLGLSTMAAAGIGNLISDVVGVFSGDAVENAATKAGITQPELTGEQESHRVTKIVKILAPALGISFGCILGMIPLLWQTDKFHLTDEENTLFRNVFQHHDVDVKSFINLVRQGNWRSMKKDDVIIEGEKPLSRVVVLLSGTATGFKPNGKVDHLYFADSMTDGQKQELGRRYEGEYRKYEAPMKRGSFIGGARLVESRSKDYEHRVYKNTVRASSDVRFIEWDFHQMRELMEGDKHIDRAFLAHTHKELKQINQQMKVNRDEEKGKEILKNYEIILLAVVTDGIVSPAERRLAEAYVERHGISHHDHLEVLKKLGWMQHDWERGYHDAKPSEVLLKSRSRAKAFVEDENWEDHKRL